jgi:hypothetical protein
VYAALRPGRSDVVSVLFAGTARFQQFFFLKFFEFWRWRLALLRRIVVLFRQFGRRLACLIFRLVVIRGTQFGIVGRAWIG